MSFEKVLLVVTEEILRKSLEQHLQGRCHVTAVAGTAAAHDKLHKQHFELIIANTELMEDLENALANQLPGGAGKPIVIVISAFGSIESAVECLHRGAFAYLLQPFSSHQLEAILKKAEDYARLRKVNHYLSHTAPLDSEGLARSAVMEE